jgi:hypothetical protein
MRNLVRFEGLGANSQVVAIPRVPDGIGRTRRVSRGETRHSDQIGSSEYAIKRRSVVERRS